MSLIYVIPEWVICADPGCMGCEHSVPHKIGEVDSSCDPQEEGNCFGCIPHSPDIRKGAKE